jgi:single-stranded-DNA-specific exonuclease
MPAESETDFSSVAAALEIHPLAARVLVNRGYRTVAEATAFLADELASLPDPFLLKGMTQAVERLHRAIRQKEKITLYGDYDVDGVCSTSLLFLFLRDLGGCVATYIPHRLDEGYGLNLPAIERIAADGTTLLVTLDCGITSVAELAKARALGLDAIVVDHHQVPETMPAAVAVLNPHQPGCQYPTRHLCAAGVAFNLCLALRKQLRAQGAFAAGKEPNLKVMLDLVALATIADVMPLTGANRVFVKHGLAMLSSAARPGVRALKEAAGLSGDAEVSSRQVGFQLGPRINAAGRLDDASVGMRLLCAPDLASARPLAQALDAANAERRSIERDILAAALGQAEALGGARGFVLASENWHPGVIGIVASRLVERFHRPTVMVAVKDGVGRGSGRSIEGFHLFKALEECSSHLSKFGGHKHAAGLSIASDRLPQFAEAFTRVATRQLSEEDLLPRCRVDACVSLRELDESAVRGVEALAPFGCGNPQPVFASRSLACSPRLLTNKRQGEQHHLKLSLDGASGLSAIGFGMGDRIALTEGPVDLAYQVEIDSWNGRERVSLKLKDIRTAS